MISYSSTPYRLIEYCIVGSYCVGLWAGKLILCNLHSTLQMVAPYEKLSPYFKENQFHYSLAYI